MANSTWRNAAKRKTHKERAQPLARKKLGLLEKHKDYVLRAKDFHRKEKTIKTLQRKAEERNPDEFYFAMEKARTVDGVHDGRLTKANKYKQEELKLMMTQDVKYLSSKARAEASKVRKAREALHFIGLPAQSKHVVFVDSKEEAEGFDAAKHFDTPAELLGRQYNRPRREQLQREGQVPTGAQAKRDVKKAEKRRFAAYRELVQRSERRDKVGAAASHLEYLKEVAHGRGRKRKLRPAEVAAAAATAAGSGGGSDYSANGGTASKQRVFKWKRERKK